MAEKKIPQIDNAGLRRIAEERLGKGAGTEHRALDETQRLLHELEIHKIELEMQNAELSTARADAEAMLEKYTDLYEFAPVGYYTLDRKGTILSVNLTGAGLLGIERSRLICRSFEHLVADMARPAFAAFLERVFTSLAKETCELPLLKEGHPPLFVQIEAMAASSGQECRIALIDITERMTAEDVLRRVKEAVEEALQKVDEATGEAFLMVEEAAEAALLRTHETKTPLTLEEAADATLRKVEEAANMARRKVDEAAEEARLKVKEAAKTLRQEKGATDLALQKLEKAAEEARVKLEKAAEQGIRKLKLAAVALQKMTEATDALRLEKVLAEASTKAKSQFLANMSHELRTPMTGVLGMLDLALAGNLEKEQREFITVAQSSARSLIRILNDILDLTKIEMGKFSIEEQPFSLRKCVEDTKNILLPASKNKGLDLDFMVADNVPETLVGDQTRINQILTNLAGNAVKFTQKGRVELRVTAGGDIPGGKREVNFTVADTGIGIPDDKKHLLFHAFRQADESHAREYGGTGLGLAISKEIVERMGGTITFTSEEGKGSTFSFVIPLGEPETERDTTFAPVETATAWDAPRTEETRKPRLLAAEDDPVISDILGLMFRRTNYEVDIAGNGLKVVEMWENGNYDLILMDVQMPLMDGFGATAAIREKERTRGGHVPIVAMTAYALKEDKEMCFNAGMDAYISKPIDFAVCRQLIEEVLKKRL